MKAVEKYWKSGYGKIDCRKAYYDMTTVYLELTLPSFGFGLCWANYVTFAVNQWLPLTEFLRVNNDHQVHNAVMVGYPRFSYKRIPWCQNLIISIYLKLKTYCFNIFAKKFSIFGIK